MTDNNETTQKYQPPKVIYIDVDGTLIQRKKVNVPLVEWARKKHDDEGYQIIVWSSRGAGNAHLAVVQADIGDIVSHMLSKPGYIVDDKGWSWIKFTRQVNDFFDSSVTTRRRSTVKRKKTPIVFSQ